MHIESEIYTYALITALRDEGRNYSDVFCPFVLESVPDKTYISIGEIQGLIKKAKTFRAEIPLHVLKTILKRARKNEYIECGTRSETDDASGLVVNVPIFRLLEKGSKYVQRIIEASDVKAEIKILCDNILLYFKNRHAYRISHEQIYTTLLGFIRKNISRLGPLLGTDSLITEHVISGSHKDEKLLVEFLRFVRDKNDENYRIFRKMIYGSIISIILYTPEHQFVQLPSKKLKPCKVYLDTNFIFSVLDMHTHEESKSAQELFKLLKDSAFEVKVFNFTIYEMRRVMQGYFMYLKTGEGYPFRGTRFRLYDSLKYNKKWRDEDARKFITDIEQILIDSGIKIEKVSLEKVKRYEDVNTQLNDLLKEKKPKQSVMSRRHDLAAITLTEEKRGGRIWSIEDAKAFFLTSDKTLAELNYSDMEHKQDGSLCEVILDGLLANILWLKDPRLDFPLEVIIACNSRDLFINENIWKSFYTKLKTLYINNHITTDDIVSLFYDNFIDEFLSEFDEGEFDDINDNVILDNIKKANERVKKKLELARKDGQKELKKVRAELDNFFQILDEKESEIKLTKLNAVNVYNEQQLMLMRDLAQRHAKKIVKIIFGAENIIFVILMVLWGTLCLWWFVLVTFLLLALLAILKSSNKWPWSILKDMIYEKEYEKMKILHGDYLQLDNRSFQMEDGQVIS